MNPRTLVYLLLLVLLAGSFWLKRNLQSDPAPETADSTLEYAMEDLFLLSSGAEGQPQLQLKAARLYKKARDAWLLLEQPEILLGGEETRGKPPTETPWAWKIHAQQGKLAEDSSQIWLQGTVRLQQLNAHPALDMNGESLHYDIRKRIAQSRDPVHLQQGGLNMLGQSLWADLRQHQVKLEQGVEGQYHVP